MKPKSNRKGDSINACQTPDYALDPLLPYLPLNSIVWEPAAGEGFLARNLRRNGFANVLCSDILSGQDFFKWQPAHGWDILVTNPPYNPNGIKPAWVRRCYELGKPWANLMPVETIGSGEVQALFDTYGVEIIYLDKRVNFKMPRKGWGGKAQFPVAWYTWGLGIGKQITFASIYRREQDQLPLFVYADPQLPLI